MRPFRGILSCVALTLLVTGAACTSDEPQVPTPSVAPSGGPVTSNAAVAFVPGEYRYTFNGIDASLTLDAGTGALEIQNASGADLAAPVVYAIMGDGTRQNGTIEGAQPIADGSSDSLTVTFPQDVTPEAVGLIVLSFGSDNVGAFAPVPVAGS